MLCRVRRGTGISMLGPMSRSSHSTSSSCQLDNYCGWRLCNLIIRAMRLAPRTISIFIHTSTRPCLHILKPCGHNLLLLLRIACGSGEFFQCLLKKKGTTINICSLVVPGTQLARVYFRSSNESLSIRQTPECVAKSLSIHRNSCTSFFWLWLSTARK